MKQKYIYKSSSLSFNVRDPDITRPVEMWRWKGEDLEECLMDDIKLLGLQPEWAIFRDMRKDFILDKRLTLAKCLAYRIERHMKEEEAKCGRNGCFKN